MPTYDPTPGFSRDYRRLSSERQRAFRAALQVFIAALRTQPPDFSPALRVKRVQGTRGVWEMSFAADGRATFEYGAEREPGVPHVIWRRVGDHSILERP